MFGFSVFNHSSPYFHHLLLKNYGSHTYIPCLDQYPLSISITHITTNWVISNREWRKKKKKTVFELSKQRVRLDCTESGWNTMLRFPFFFFNFQPHYLTKSTVNSIFVHCLRTHKFHFSVTFSLKIGLTILFTHLKIILLQYFQFQFSISVKINSIQATQSYGGTLLISHIMGLTVIVLSCHSSGFAPHQRS